MGTIQFIVEGTMTEALERRLNMLCRVKYRLPAIGGYVVEADESAREQVRGMEGVMQIHEIARIAAQAFRTAQPRNTTEVFGIEQTRMAANRIAAQMRRADAAVHANTQAPGELPERHGITGLTGRGVTIAILDTGIAPVDDLVTPRNRIVAFADFINGRKVPYDDNAHGTHVAGLKQQPL